MASASRKARKTFSGLVARTRCKRTVLPWDMTLFSPLLSGVYRRIWLGSLSLYHKDAWPPCEPTWGLKKSAAGARAGSGLGDCRIGKVFHARVRQFRQHDASQSSVSRLYAATSPAPDGVGPRVATCRRRRPR